MRNHHHRGEKPEALGAARQKGDGGEHVEAVSVLGRRPGTALRIGIHGGELTRHDDVIAHRHEVEARALGRLGDGHVGFAAGEDATRQSADAEFHAGLLLTSPRG